MTGCVRTEPRHISNTETLKDTQTKHKTKMKDKQLFEGKTKKHIVIFFFKLSSC